MQNIIRKKTKITLFLRFFFYKKILRYRKIRSNKFGDTLITEAYVLPSKTVHLVIRKPPKFRFQPGDYVFVNIPVIAKYEWHPFSISSAPEKSDFIWLHIRVCGNWTKRLYSFASSPKFDVNNSFMQRSMSRINMRRHMSRAYQINDSIAMVNTSVKSKSRTVMANNFLSIELPKKTVSFDSNEKVKVMTDSIIDKQSEQAITTENNNENENLANRPTHKGILKVSIIIKLELLYILVRQFNNVI